jgi:hypothetical protein
LRLGLFAAALQAMILLPYCPLHASVPKRPNWRGANAKKALRDALFRQFYIFVVSRRIVVSRLLQIQFIDLPPFLSTANNKNAKKISSFFKISPPKAPAKSKLPEIYYK